MHRHAAASHRLVPGLPAVLLALTAAACGPVPAPTSAPTPDASDTVAAAHAPVDSAWVRAHYHKREVYVPMRDGTR
ncbi:MAG: hypothetical protein ACOCUW_02475, partial [Gemmatimonadota bacterium]